MKSLILLLTLVSVSFVYANEEATIETVTTETLVEDVETTTEDTNEEEAVVILETPITNTCVNFTTVQTFEDGADYYAEFDKQIINPLEESGYGELALYYLNTVVILGSKNFSESDCETIKMAESGEDVSDQIVLTEEEQADLNVHEMDLEGFGVLVRCVGFVDKGDGLKKYIADITYPMSNEDYNTLENDTLENGSATVVAETPVTVRVTTEYKGVVKESFGEFTTAKITQSEDSYSMETNNKSTEQSASYSNTTESPSTLMINLNPNTPAAEFKNAVCTTDYAG